MDILISKIIRYPHFSELQIKITLHECHKIGWQTSPLTVCLLFKSFGNWTTVTLMFGICLATTNALISQCTWFSNGDLTSTEK